MNIGSFLHRDQALYGVFNGETVAPASPGLIAQYPTLRDLLDAEKSEALKGSVNLSATIPIAEITFQPPIPNPRKIICVGMNYPKPYPVDGVAPPSPEHIVLFGKESETLVGHGATLEAPHGTPADSFDYEGEIAVVVRKPARHVTATQAMDHVLGYAPFNDGSVRDWQKHSIYAGKNFANSGSWGPWVTTADALPRVEDLHLTGKDVEQCEKYLSWNGHGFEIGDDVREAQLGSIQKVVLMLIRESPRCMQKHIVDTTGKDQGQISKAIDKLVEVGLVVKTEGRLMAQ
jgi:2-keto-4-pentenoate hydratase/2-oxohepta-3-ene-1,7-dioic acid hydratase in catechol pathway